MASQKRASRLRPESVKNWRTWTLLENGASETQVKQILGLVPSTVKYHVSQLKALRSKQEPFKIESGNYWIAATSAACRLYSALDPILDADVREVLRKRHIDLPLAKLCNIVVRKYKFRGTTEERDDLVQDAIVMCLSALDNIDQDTQRSLFSYFTIVAKNVVWNTHQTQKRRPHGHLVSRRERDGEENDPLMLVKDDAPGLLNYELGLNHDLEDSSVYSEVLLEFRDWITKTYMIDIPRMKNMVTMLDYLIDSDDPQWMRQPELTTLTRNAKVCTKPMLRCAFRKFLDSEPELADMLGLVIKRDDKRAQKKTNRSMNDIFTRKRIEQ